MLVPGSHEYILVAMVIVQSGLVLTFLRFGNEQSMHECFFIIPCIWSQAAIIFLQCLKHLSDDISVLSQLGISDISVSCTPNVPSITRLFIIDKRN
jgi:hypothetical protein